MAVTTLGGTKGHKGGDLRAEPSRQGDGNHLCGRVVARQGGDPTGWDTGAPGLFRALGPAPLRVVLAKPVAVSLVQTIFRGPPDHHTCWLLTL